MPLNVPVNVPPDANRARDENCKISAVRTLRGTLGGALRGALRGTLRGTLQGAFDKQCSPSSQRLATGSSRLLPITLMRSKRGTQSGCSWWQDKCVGGSLTVWVKNVSCVCEGISKHKLFVKEACIHCNRVGQACIPTDIAQANFKKFEGGVSGRDFCRLGGSEPTWEEKNLKHQTFWRCGQIVSSAELFSIVAGSWLTLTNYSHCSLSFFDYFSSKTCRWCHH